MKCGTDTDDPRIRMRAGESSRPRTKMRPDHSKTPIGQMIAIGRGRYQVRFEDQGVEVRAIRAKGLKRGSVIMGDRVRVTRDSLDRVGTFARIIAAEERSTVLHRFLEDAPGLRGEKAIVANTELVCIVIALADPPPRMGTIDRCLVAAYKAKMRPILCLTEADLARPGEPLEAYRPFDVTAIVTSADNLDSVDELRRELEERFLVLVSHSGIERLTLINVLVPSANRAVGHVNEITGWGRHTSASSEAFESTGGGWIVDTPGVCSSGTGHVSVKDIFPVSPEVGEAIGHCLPLYSHSHEELSCTIDAWAKEHSPFGPVEEEVSAKRKSMTEPARRLPASVATAEAVSRTMR